MLSLCAHDTTCITSCTKEPTPQPPVYNWLAESNLLAWCYPTVIDFYLEKQNDSPQRWSVQTHLCQNFRMFWFPLNLKLKKCNAALSTGLGKNLILQFFDVAAEIECRTSCLAFTEHYQWPNFSDQKHGSFSYINCWFNIGDDGSRASWK